MSCPFKGKAAFAVVIFMLAFGERVESRIWVRSVEPRTQMVSLPRTASLPLANSRVRREAPPPPGDNGKLLVDFTDLPDEGHNEAIVHWSGKDSQVRDAIDSPIDKAARGSIVFVNVDTRIICLRLHE